MDAPLHRALALAAGVLVSKLLFIASYVGALHDPEPRGVTVATVGLPPAALAGLRAQGFDAQVKPDEQAARRAILDRDVEGGLVASRAGVNAMVASAASPAAAAAVQAAAAALATQSGSHVVHTELRPLPHDDGRGLSGFYLVVGWIVGGYLGGTALRLFAPNLGLRRGLGLAVGYAIASGVLGTAIVAALFGGLNGAVPGVMLVGTLVSLVASIVTAGIQRHLGLAGTAVAILLFVVLGNPASGGPFPWSFLPQPWQFLGPLTPTGAATELVRDVAYFDGRGGAQSLIVLLAWLVFGRALILFGRRRPIPPPDDRELAAGIVVA